MPAAIYLQKHIELGKLDLNFSINCWAGGPKATQLPPKIPNMSMHIYINCDTVSANSIFACQSII